MTQPYCRSCYRSVDAGRELCADCLRAPQPAARSRALVLAILAFSGVIFGMLTLNVSLCVASAALAAVALFRR